MGPAFVSTAVATFLRVRFALESEFHHPMSSPPILPNFISPNPPRLIAALPRNHVPRDGPKDWEEVECIHELGRGSTAPRDAAFLGQARHDSDPEVVRHGDGRADNAHQPPLPEESSETAENRRARVDCTQPQQWRGTGGGRVGEWGEQSRGPEGEP